LLTKCLTPKAIFKKQLLIDAKVQLFYENNPK